MYAMFGLRMSSHDHNTTCGGGTFHEPVDIIGDEPQDNRLRGRFFHVEEFRQREVPRARRIWLEVQFPNGTPCDFRIGLRFLDQAAYGAIESRNLVKVLHDQLRKA